MINQAHNIEKTGMTRAQAEAMVKVIHDSIADALKPLTDRMDGMATKADLTELRGEMAASEKHMTLIVVFASIAIIGTMVVATVFG